MLPGQPNQSVLDGMRCLQELAASQEPVGVRELARRLKLDATRVNRLLRTMAHTGMLQRSKKGTYAPGPALFVMSTRNLYGSGFFRRVLGVLESLRAEDLTAGMGTLWNTHVSYIFHSKPRMTAEEAMGRVSLAPATGSSIGMCLLALRSDPEIKALYRDAAIPGFEDSGLSGLLEELSEIRRRGYAVTRSLTDSRQVSVGMTIGNPPLWGIALSGVLAPKRIPQVVRTLRSASAKAGFFAENTRVPDRRQSTRVSGKGARG